MDFVLSVFDGRRASIEGSLWLKKEVPKLPSFQSLESNDSFMDILVILLKGLEKSVSIFFQLLYWRISVYLYCSIVLYLHWMFTSFKQSFDKPVGQFLLLDCKKQIARRFAYSDNVCFHYAQHAASKTNTLSNYLQRFTNTSIMM